MASMADLERIAGELPGVTRELYEGRPVWVAGRKKFIRHRTDRADALDPDTGERLPDVLMFRTESIEARDALREHPSGAYFITDHFANYPAILTRIPHLARLTTDDLDDLTVEAWLTCAPKRIAKQSLEEQQAN